MASGAGDTGIPWANGSTSHTAYYRPTVLASPNQSLLREKITCYMLQHTCKHKHAELVWFTVTKRPLFHMSRHWKKNTHTHQTQLCIRKPNRFDFNIMLERRVIKCNGCGIQNWGQWAKEAICQLRERERDGRKVTDDGIVPALVSMGKVWRSFDLWSLQSFRICPLPSHTTAFQKALSDCNY